MGVPAIVVEILAEGTRGRDAGKKLDLYMPTGSWSTGRPIPSIGK